MTGRCSLGPQTARLRPVAHSRTAIHAYSLKAAPEPRGNFQARLVFPEAVAEFAVEVDLAAELAPVNPSPRR